MMSSVPHASHLAAAVTIVSVLGLAPLSAAASSANTDFYAGKTVRLIVSSSAGGGYDTYSRAIARHLADFIPGDPTVIVQNMPGAGGIKAGNYLYQLAEKDGTVIAGLQNSVPFEPLMGVKAAMFDPLQFNWLGSPNSEVGLLLVWHTSPVNTLLDATKKEVVVGASGAASTPAFYARILNTVFDTQLKLINGYPGQTEAFLAMEKGELDGYPSTFWGSLKSTRPDWIRDKQVKILVQYGEKRHPELPDVPVARDLAKTADDKQLLDVAMAPLVIGRPYVAPPDVPAQRVAALRGALMGTFRDIAFLAEAEKLHLEVDAAPQSGEDIRNVLMRTYAAPKPVLDRLRTIYEVGQKQASN
jgi:tripartite-type tricarboxylate transporter receptor subunit TctC